MPAGDAVICKQNLPAGMHIHSLQSVYNPLLQLGIFFFLGGGEFCKGLQFARLCD